MNEDQELLQRATRALREQTAAPERRSGLTRARVLDAASARKRPLWRFLLPLVLVLGTSTALARVAFPQQVDALFEAVIEPLRAPAKHAVVEKKPVAKVAPAPAPAIASEIPQAAPLAPAPPEPVVKITPRSPKRTRPELAPSVAPEAPVLTVQPAPPAESAELLLFRRAERLHRARDPEAIAAWDAYLRVAPEGALVPEARYNRALALVRAGREDEARAALAPFAAGELGGYRKREARALLEQLGRGD